MKHVTHKVSLTLDSCENTLVLFNGFMTYWRKKAERSLINSLKDRDWLTPEFFLLYLQNEVEGKVATLLYLVLAGSLFSHTCTGESFSRDLSEPALLPSAMRCSHSNTQAQDAPSPPTTPSSKGYVLHQFRAIFIQFMLIAIFLARAF